MASASPPGASGAQAGGPPFRIQLRGLGPALNKLDPADPFYAPAVHQAFADLGKLGQAYVRTRAPRGRTGRLANSIVHVLDARPVPRFVKIGWPRGGGPMPTRSGFRYPGALEGGPRFHYRSGPLKGRPTRGWLSGARKFLRTQARRLLTTAARQIEAAWSAGGAPPAGGPGPTVGPGGGA
jgi:hypothetical protein